MEEKKEDGLYPYGPVHDKDQNEITVYLDETRLTKQEIEMLEDGDDEFLLEGGMVQAFYVPQEYVDHITIYLCEEKEEKEISYEEYIARINGSDFDDVDFFTERKALPEGIMDAIDDALGSDYWDGAINVDDSEYYAVIKHGEYFKTYSVTLQAKEV